MTQATTDLDVSVSAARGSFRRHLRAANKAQRTIVGYLDALTQLDRFLDRMGMPRSVGAIRREHLEAFMVDMQERGLTPSSVANRYRSLRVFFNWLVSEEEITRSPMERMTAPIIPEVPVPLLTQRQVEALLATCDGSTREDRRDLAILRVLIDTGIRRAECVGLRVADWDQDRDQLWIEQGKGRRSRPVALHKGTAKALDRYVLRVRPRHLAHSEEAMFLGLRGPLGEGGLLQMVKRRGEEAGIVGLHPHMLRHLAAHNDAEDGLSVPDAMKKMGWKSSAMALRYGSSAATERSLAHSRAVRGSDRYS
jgi:site-specific recombinase XerD